MTLQVSKPRARPRWLVLLTVLALLSAFGAGTAFAVHDDGVFELDRNALDDAAAGDDWENIFDETDLADRAPPASFSTTLGRPPLHRWRLERRPEHYELEAQERQLPREG